jgi:type I restriction enzyme S subunit
MNLSGSQSEAGSLPKGWTIATISGLTDEVRPGFPSGKHNRNKEGIPHIRPMNINLRGEIDLSDIKYVEVRSCDTLKGGDILFNNTNSSALLGKTALIRKDTDWAYSNHMTRIRLGEIRPLPAWIAYYLHTLFLRGYFRMLCVHHVNQASVNTTILSGRVDIPIAPLESRSG